MKITTSQVLKILHVLAWIIFAGLGIDAGGYISNALYTMLINPEHARNFWGWHDLSGLYKFDPGYFLIETMLMSIVCITKALIFYLIVRILHQKKIDLAQPFNRETGRFIFNVAYLSFFTGLLSIWGANYAAWFEKQGVQMPDIQKLHLGGGDVWLFMSVTLYIIAQIFKRGIEIQSENELTV